jgi:hypothetical protein
MKVLKFAATEVDERKNYLLIILNSSDFKFLMLDAQLLLLDAQRLTLKTIK